ncbi:MAG: T9SS type A sorting domain-containing protein, partial [candidate division KSB1 bacterium]|nr:T9SS type A sorting domain-containing protein [candidate division KSB1 bacterium]
APSAFELSQNYPNTFNPSTTIEYTLTNPGNATLTVYNAVGEKIAVLANGFHQSGLHRATWRGTDDLGRPVNSGVYFYRLEAEGKALTQKMLLVR